MFYCDNCASIRDWPTSLWGRSRGKCEMCGKQGPCNETPSKHLPARLPVRPIEPEPTQAEVDAAIESIKSTQQGGEA